ncbi:MAG: 2-oxoglutarate dehydrogenase complex dihydrolipoyllysine-residue succinyltransferase [Sphingobacteriia bacterium]|nr:2-oxoglutarate dehydrogenase complex dihydrolipoyllysine-residue succinyltransferase [Sphingobacteriia bacterium]
MIIEIKVPSPGESISEVQLAGWFFQSGDFVEKDAEIAEIDSDKATLTINAAESGKINILIEAGETVEIGTVICTIDTEADAPASIGKKEEPPAKASEKLPETKTEKKETGIPEQPEPIVQENQEKSTDIHLSPLARRMLEANNLTGDDLLDFYKKLRISKDDVVRFLEDKNTLSAETVRMPVTAQREGNRETERKKMSTLRLKLAERLVAVKNETAMLTTFNEVNMTPVIQMRNKYKDAFKEKYGVSLGFMSFFTKAVTEALLQFPQVNAHIDGNDLVFHHYADIGIAVSAPKGLMVPVIRNAETMMLHEIEAAIKELATKARNGKLTIEEMTGGTFTITNGGVFGSMLSTPIINPPQSAILGMHNIVERPVAINGKVEIHPVMYVALSYDHRIIDGKESVSFLVKVKEMLEDPARMLFAGNDPAMTLLGL